MDEFEHDGYDALLVVSFGGPEGPDDVMAFLEHVTDGRAISRERLAQVGAHYALFGGVSPINGHNRALVGAVRAELRARSVDLSVHWGNRHWHPFLAETLQAMADDGVRRALAFVTSAFGSYSGCRQYVEAVEVARAEVGPRAPVVHKLRTYFDHPGFVEPMARDLRAALAESGASGASGSAGPAVVFTAHSIPVTMAHASPYIAQLNEACRLVATLAGLGGGTWDLVFQSRSGPPQVPWLEPDVNDHLRALRRQGVTEVVLVPIGFTSDHMEVVYDLDTQARETASEIGMGLRRVPTVGTDPAFVAMIAELVHERLDPTAPRRALSSLGPAPDVCSASCCPAPGRPSASGRWVTGPADA